MTFGTIPQSSALAEANPLSLGEIMGTSPQDREKFEAAVKVITAELRAMRERFMKNEGEKAGAKAAKAAKPSGAEAIKRSMTSQTEIDF